MQRLLNPLALAFFVLVLAPARDAYAYLDPGTGSFILQLLIASVLGALFTIKLWFGKVKRVFQRVLGTEAATAEGTPADVPTGDDSETSKPS